MLNQIFGRRAATKPLRTFGALDFQ